MKQYKQQGPRMAWEIFKSINNLYDKDNQYSSTILYHLYFGNTNKILTNYKWLEEMAIIDGV